MNAILVLVAERPELWAELLGDALPGREIRVGAPPGEGPDPAARPAAYVVTDRLPPGVLERLPALRALFSVNAGIERLLEEHAIPPSLPIVRMADDGLAEGMLEWVLAVVMGWHRNLFSYRDAQLRGAWEPLEERLARDRTVTVLGAGHLGAPVAAMLARIGFSVRCWSRSPKRIERVSSFSGPEALGDAVAGADFLVNLLPLTPDTENIVDAALLRRLARGAVLANAGRGRHVVDEAVLTALDEGQLRAAVLDVFRAEPLPPGHPFWSHPGVFLHPHVAAPTVPRSAARRIADQIRALEGGRPLQDVVDRGRGY
ncbi:2-hydroxyacid dehydrogenase [Rhizosaccharibacter radicis]|uniref:Glyoxylate/hydroxypyruvate reductase A n=1 Tax=Rhizosaccharibacter radicis TaxID=2782605 RepID=A0ABT1W1G2_9PROT|nr:glyoxylate/hydroxypyruvate reductase A [Acetobacteraceae bacterium KSS12]